MTKLIQRAKLGLRRSLVAYINVGLEKARWGWCKVQIVLFVTKILPRKDLLPLPPDYVCNDTQGLWKLESKESKGAERWLSFTIESGTQVDWE